MIFNLNLPELLEYPNGFPDYWLNIIFRNKPSTVCYKGRAVIPTYVRLVEAAMTEYREARSLIYKACNEHGMGLPDSIRACAYFEACLSNMHRAVRFMITIRSSRHVPRALKDLFPGKPMPLFTRPHIANRIRDVRDEIHHLDEHILQGVISENATFALRASGPETTVPHEPGQTLKTIDRLQIGSYEIPFSDLYKWLVEMAHCAKQISDYERLSGCSVV